MSGGKKIAEWWLEPTTPEQCGENPESNNCVDSVTRILSLSMHVPESR